MSTVLIVDDEQSILDIATAILNRFDYKTITAQDANGAIATIEAGGIDIVLLDVILPGRGGLDLLMEIRQTWPDLPVVIMSGKVRTDTMSFTKLTAQFGARAIIAKPFTPSELVSSLGAILAK